MEARPRTPLEVIKAEFFLELLMRLLAGQRTLVAPAKSLIGVFASKFER